MNQGGCSVPLAGPQSIFTYKLVFVPNWVSEFTFGSLVILRFEKRLESQAMLPYDMYYVFMKLQEDGEVLNPEDSQNPQCIAFWVRFIKHCSYSL